MLRLVYLVLIAAPVRMPQGSHGPRPASRLPQNEDQWAERVAALDSHARLKLKIELSRKVDLACDAGMLSNAAFGNCVSADAAITERNYRAFARTLHAALEIRPPEEDPKIFPTPAKNFVAGEIAWRSFVDKTCEALGDTDYGGSGAPTDMTACRQNLTRQHMKDLAAIFLKQ